MLEAAQAVEDSMVHLVQQGDLVAAEPAVLIIMVEDLQPVEEELVEPMALEPEVVVQDLTTEEESESVLNPEAEELEL